MIWHICEEVLSFLLFAFLLWAMFAPTFFSIFVYKNTTNVVFIVAALNFAGLFLIHFFYIFLFYIAAMLFTHVGEVKNTSIFHTPT